MRWTFEPDFTLTALSEKSRQVWCLCEELTITGTDIMATPSHSQVRLLRQALLLTLSISLLGQSVTTAAISTCPEYDDTSMHNTYCATLSYVVKEKPECFRLPASAVPDYYLVDDALIHSDKSAETSVLNVVNRFWDIKCGQREMKDMNEYFSWALRTNPYYVKEQFTDLLKRLFPNKKVPKFNSLLLPGAGALFELKSIFQLMEPSSILAIDPSRNGEELTNLIIKDSPYIQKKIKKLNKYHYVRGFLGSRCEAPGCDGAPAINVTNKVDAVMFIHPGVLVTPKNSLSTAWKDTFDSSLHALKPGGQAIFILQTEQERNLLQKYVSKQPDYKIAAAHCGRGLFHTPFIYPQARFYTCGVRVEKSFKAIKEPHPEL